MDLDAVVGPQGPASEAADLDLVDEDMVDAAEGNGKGVEGDEGRAEARESLATLRQSRWAKAAEDSPAEDEERREEEDGPARREAAPPQGQPGKGGDPSHSRSASPEAGEYRRSRSPGLGLKRVAEGGASGDSAGGGGSNVRARDNDSEYERELNRREREELMDGDGEEEEEQRPETESDGSPDLRAGRGRGGGRRINMLQGCRSVDDFERLNRIDEGTYGVVYRARDKRSGEVVALKKVKMDKEREGFPMTSLREINILLSFSHPSIVDVKEVVVGSNLDSIFMVMEYMEHDVKSLMESMKVPFSQSETKCLMEQLLEGTRYLHDNWVLHRDLKTSNLLLNNRGELKICDFGLARQYGSPLRPYTQMVVTLWYRAPELLLGAKKYSTAIDIWSLGCIMAELLSKEPLFAGKSEIDQIDKIFKLLGTPNEQIWKAYPTLPNVKKVNFVKQPYNNLRSKFPATAFGGRPALSEAGFDLLNKMLTYDPEKRITAEEALKHEWFKEVPLPKAKELMPTFPARNETDRRLRRLHKSPDPLEEQRKREALGPAGLFG